MGVLHLEGVEQFKKEAIEFEGVVLVDFWAERCGPCRMLGPILEEIDAENQGKAVKIIKVNVDSQVNAPLAQSFQVSSIPAVFVLKDGQVVQPIIGVNPKNVYQGIIDQLLADNSEGEESATTGKKIDMNTDMPMAA